MGRNAEYVGENFTLGIFHDMNTDFLTVVHSSGPGDGARSALVLSIVGEGVPA